MQTVLAAVDNSSWTAVVAEYASDLARLAEAEVLATYVIDTRLVEGAFARMVGVDLMGGAEAEGMASLSEMLERHGREALDLVASVCQRKQVKCDTKIERGRPATALAFLAPMYDLAVIGSHGSEAEFRSCLLGSTATELTRLSTRPVLVVREEYRPIARAVVGYDGSPEATRALETVVGLARGGQWSLTVVVAGEGAAVDTLAAQARKFRGMDDIASEVTVRRGDASHVLLDTVEEVGAELVAVGARGVSKLAKFLLGSTSDTLLCQSPAPVMVFR